MHLLFFNEFGHWLDLTYFKLVIMMSWCIVVDS